MSNLRREMRKAVVNSASGAAAKIKRVHGNHIFDDEPHKFALNIDFLHNTKYARKQHAKVSQREPFTYVELRIDGSEICGVGFSKCARHEGGKMHDVYDANKGIEIAIARASKELVEGIIGEMYKDQDFSRAITSNIEQVA